MIKECIDESKIPNLTEWINYLYRRYIISTYFRYPQSASAAHPAARC